jgi:hypothetical protein
MGLFHWSNIIRIAISRFNLISLFPIVVYPLIMHMMANHAFESGPPSAAAQRER